MTPDDGEGLDCLVDTLIRTSAAERDVASPSVEPMARSTTRFRPLDDEVRCGGQGIVQFHRDQLLGRNVAIKLLRSGLDDEARVDFLREAAITAQLEHPSVVPIHDLYLEPDGRPSFAMKLVRGASLSQVLAANEQPPPTSRLQDLVDVVIKLCDALGFAHARGIVHCDVKPDNVMIGQHGEVLLLDWGIARRMDEPRPADSVSGTIQYMAPEQARGEAMTAPTIDVFALGAILYEMCEGRPLRSSTGFKGLLEAAEHELPALSDRVPAGLQQVLERALAPRPGDRYPSTRALKADLVRCQRGELVARVVELEAGTVILREGELGDEAYVIEEGRCRVTTEREGVTTTIRSMGPGDVFGELALLGRGRRTATVTAEEKVVLRVLDRRAVERELAATQPWLAQLVKGLAARLTDRP